MSFNYNPIRSRNLFNVNANSSYKISRSKIEDFLKCPRCFYLDRKCGTGHPPSFPFTLNNAVDTLLKKEFDKFRKAQTIHPLCIQYGINAIPFEHKDIENWRMNQRGIQHLHELTNFCITGAIDDVWMDQNTRELIIVDYKATSTKEEITLDADYRKSYKRQMEIYQWLFRKNGFNVSLTGYFVYCNGKTEKDLFEGKLEFEIVLLPYSGDDSWIEQTLIEIRRCLESEEFPNSSSECAFCQYHQAVRKHIIQ